MTQELHSLLRRQLRRHGVELDGLSDEFHALLDAVDSAYKDADEDRLTVERSLDLSSQELLTANAEMRAVFEALPDVFLKTESTGRIVECRAPGRDLYGLPVRLRECPSLHELLGAQADDAIAALQRVEETSQPETLEVTFPGASAHSTYEVRIVPMGKGHQLVALRDMTARVEAEAALRRSEERFRSLAQNSYDMIVVVNGEGRATYASPSVAKIMGFEQEDWESMDILSLVHPDHRERAAHSLSGVISEAGIHPPTEVLLRRKDGTYRWIEMVAQNLLDDPAVGGVVYNARDVTDRRQAEDALRESEERFRSLVQNASDLILIIDSDTTLLYTSPSVERVVGKSNEQDGSRRLIDLVHPDDADALLAFLDEATHKRRTASIEARLRCDDGSWPLFEFAGTDQRDSPTIAGFVLNARDVTERRDLEDQLRHQAFHDSLTDLANRARFTDRLEHALERARRGRAEVVLVFLDIDDFKAINDGIGHGGGDEALKEVATRLQSCLRAGDTAARLGGDEFAILLEDTGIEGARALAKRIIESLSTPVRVGNEQLAVRASIGIAAGNGSDADADALLRNADIAMYTAKDRGKGRIELYRPAMRARLMERLTLMRDLEHALANDEIVVEYQPLIDLTSSEIVGFEALARWNHPRLGVLPPAEFIGLAEDSAFIVPLGRYVLEQACSQAKQWQEEFPRDPPRSMSVNVSVKQLQQQQFIETLRDVLTTTGLDSGSLILEVTESIMLHDVPSTVGLLEAIKAEGVKVAIDDFGTGYSSLSYLSRFPFDILKIDKSFIDRRGSSEREGVLARAIIDLGQKFAVGVVAEGIEDRRELELLRRLGCKIGQGFYFTRPSSADDIGKLLGASAEDTEAA